MRQAIFFFLRFIYSKERERGRGVGEREGERDSKCESTGWRGRERERKSQVISALSEEPDEGLDFMTLRS